MECPECGYLLDEFETQCARCKWRPPASAQAAQQPVAQQPLQPPGPVPGAQQPMQPPGVVPGVAQPVQPTAPPSEAAGKVSRMAGVSPAEAEAALQATGGDVGAAVQHIRSSGTRRIAKIVVPVACILGALAGFFIVRGCLAKPEPLNLLPAHQGADWKRVAKFESGSNLAISVVGDTTDWFTVGSRWKIVWCHAAAKGKAEPNAPKGMGISYYAEGDDITSAIKSHPVNSFDGELEGEAPMSGAGKHCLLIEALGVWEIQVWTYTGT